MGCGKSSVGRRLSELLCCPFMDLDNAIEERTGRAIPEIFANDGEAAFRALELDVLKDTVCRADRESQSVIVALGGGAVMTPECAEIVHDDTLCIYLRASVETLLEHLSGQTSNRPLLNADCHSDQAERAEGSLIRTRIETLMAQRAGTYEKTAHIIIDTDGKSVEAVASEIISKLG